MAERRDISGQYGEDVPDDALIIPVLESPDTPHWLSHNAGVKARLHAFVRKKRDEIFRRRVQESFPDHAGRPGQVGGSLPRGESSGAAPKDSGYHFFLGGSVESLPKENYEVANKDIQTWENKKAKYIGEDAVLDFNNEVYVIRDDKKTVQGVLSVDEMPNQKMLYVNYVAANKIGLGALLMYKVLRMAANRNLGVLLYSLDEARPFYRKLGFKTEDGSHFEMSVDAVKDWVEKHG